MKHSRRLVLHFDLNKTLVMRDTAQGNSSVTMTVCRIVSAYAWGKLVPKKGGEEGELVWQLAHDALSIVQPPRPDDCDQDLESYLHYLDRTHPALGEAEEPDKVERDRKNDEV